MIASNKSLELPEYVTRRSDSGLIKMENDTYIIIGERVYSVPSILSNGIASLWNRLERCTEVAHLIDQGNRKNISHVVISIIYLLRIGALKETSPSLAEHPNRDRLLDIAEVLGLLSLANIIRLLDLRVTIFSSKGLGNVLVRLLSALGFRITLVTNEGTADEKYKHFDCQNTTHMQRLDNSQQLSQNEGVQYEVISLSDSNDSSWPRIIQGSDVVLGCVESDDDPFLTRLNILCWNEKTPLIPLAIGQEKCSMGPSVLPTISPCLACYQNRRILHTTDRQRVKLGSNISNMFLPNSLGSVARRSMVEITGWVAALECGRLVIEPSSAKTLGRVWAFSLNTLSADVRGVLKDPNCRVCMVESHPRGAIWAPKPSFEDGETVGL